MKQWMRKFFAVLMMLCLLAGCTAWAEETTLVDVNELLDSVITAELSDNALNFDAAYTLNALNDASQNAASSADELGHEGGDLVVTADGAVVSMAVRYYNVIVAVSNADIKAATSLVIYDLNTGNGYPAQISDEENSLIFFKLDEMPNVEKLYLTNSIPAGATVGHNCDFGIYLFGYYKDGTSIGITDMTVTRPAEGELFGTYSGVELMQGSPIFCFSNDNERVTIGLADKNHRYLDFCEYDKYLRSTAASNPTAAPTSAPTAVPTSAPTTAPTTAPTAVPAGASTDAPNNPPTDAPTAVPTEVPTDAPTAAPTAAPTEAPAAESPTQTVLYVIIGVLAAAVVALMFTRGKKSGGKNQQQETPTQRYQPENPPAVPDEPTKQLTVDEPKARVALDCIGGALQGMTFPISSRVVFGRDPKRCSIIYPKDAKGISGVHCAAEPTADGQIILTDLGSTYGTMAGGQQLTAGKGVTLHPGDTFTLGGSENRFTVRRL